MVRTKSELLALIDKKAQTALKHVAEQVKKQWEDYIASRFYVNTILFSIVEQIRYNKFRTIEKEPVCG